MDLKKGRPEVENWADDRISRISSDACPQARPVTLTVPPAEAFARVRRAVEAQGLEILHQDPAAGVLEGTHESLMYGFKDDVIFRVRASGSGSRVDMRSVSRVGGSDLGANCKRVAGLVRALGGQAAR
jgi:uncharacterized protein (DUF1499 family)